MSLPVTIYHEQDVSDWTSHREGEEKVWQKLAYLQEQQDYLGALKDAKAFGIRFVLVGIPEDIGPRANCGLGGATGGWQAFLKRFLNVSANHFLPANQILLLGEVKVRDLLAQTQNLNAAKAEDLAKLRAVCAELDERVYETLAPIFAAGLEPIVIGGGHNNAYGLLKSLFNRTNSPAHAINFDPHADFRAQEGRHSGNGFSYAYHEGLLDDYHVVGLHEQKNNQAILDALKAANFTFDSYQDIKVRRTITLTKAIDKALLRFDESAPLGIEVDVDSISGMPVSAFTNCGFTVHDAEHFVYRCALSSKTRYLHLCEAAPGNHSAGAIQGENEAGQVLSGLVASYLSARTAQL